MTEPDLDPIATRLRGERPVPSPGFRGELRRRLLAQARGGSIRPRKLRLLIAVYAGSGALLLATAAIGLTGLGPLAS